MSSTMKSSISCRHHHKPGAIRVLGLSSARMTPSTRLVTGKSEPLYLKDLDNGATLVRGHQIRSKLQQGPHSKAILPERRIQPNWLVGEVVVCAESVRSTVDLAKANRRLYPSR